jgi:peptide/nickel transport system substrate-binding protein
MPELEKETMNRNRTTRWTYRLLVPIIIVATLIAGCQPDAATEAPAETGTAAAPDGPQGILRVSAIPIAQTDPSLISSDSEVLIANHVYDYLVDVDAENEIQPRLATDWTRSDDGLTYTFTLAEGVTFHDGSEMTAQDVVYTFTRLRDTEGLPTADLYSNITGIEATGDLEVTFTLSQPNPFFLYDLSDNHALIIKDGTEEATDFNGTGPFMVTEYQPENQIIMEANPDYFVEGLPKLAGLEIIFFNDQAASADALRSGQIDLTMDLSTSLYESLQNATGVETFDIATNQFALVRLRTDQAPGDDPRVIEALKLATDREAIFELVQQGYGAVGQDTPVGPIFDTYYTEEYDLPETDPQAAKDLLAEAGYPDGLDLELHLLDTLNFPDLAVVLKDQWSEAGIRVEVVTLPESVYYGEGRWLEVNLGITGWGHRAYPQFYLDVMLACDAKWNETRFCDEELDEQIEIAGSSLDEQARIDAYHEIQRILIERGPMIVPYFFAEYAAINDQFQGFALKAFSGRTDLRNVYLVSQE